MNPVRKKRLILVLVLLGGFAVAVALALVVFQQNINLFYSPAEIEAGEAPTERRIRAGGVVEEDSVIRDPESLLVRFSITDMRGSVPVEYTGILPDLFREGQGVVAMGTMDGNGVFTADQVLARHDEEYMPPEVAEALERAGKLNTGDESHYASDDDSKEDGYDYEGYGSEGYDYDGANDDSSY